MARGSFDSAEFYRAMDECQRLQVARDEVAWTVQYTPPERPYDVLLSFGCAVQHTPHLMLEAVAVLRALGVDFVAVTGRQFCCGRPYHTSGATEQAARLSSASVARFHSYQPKVMVNWCGACQVQFRDVISRQAETAFPVVHMTQFLAERLELLGDRVPWQQAVRARALVHGHDQHPQQAADLANVLKSLALVPGVEVVGLVRPPSLGSPCTLTGPTHVTIFSDIGAAEYRQIQAELERQARELGADTLVTAYHACQREWGKFASERLAIRHYISIVAQALGVGRPDRFQAYWKLANPDRVVELARPAWESWGISAEEARTLARKYFLPSYAARAPQCPCGGDPARCAAGDAAGARFGQELPVLAPAPACTPLQAAGAPGADRRPPVLTE